ncbi:hypothetical protein M413DRAFT_78127 [Hebeloma cylindrosporum]|uniref:Aminoglycoside phosphotransferase domain-containing protein n=1 Tax=Hebeloma cylindrosporum TaxID=76867 RepID=A0A0C3BIK0_HEBCY|nr:hypothetical protein M413DRAFT_78127 [Hebeloma cylindrosporum h7]
MLPTDETIFFQESSFFKHHSLSDLPNVDEIAAAALPGYNRWVSIFPKLSLAVKRTRRTERYRASAVEGQTMWALRKFLPEVRVPEVYGWRRDGDELFVFMELIKGDTLYDRWNDLTEQEKAQIFTELGTMTDALRRLVRPPEEEFIGAIGGQPMMEQLCFGQISKAFPNSVAFYEFVMRIPFSERERAFENGSRPLPFESPIVFTHSDMHAANVFITPRSSNEPPRVLAIIDWEQSGWVPSFWECAKHMYLLMFEKGQRKEMLERLAKVSGEVPEGVFMAFAEYVHSHGGYM